MSNKNTKIITITEFECDEGIKKLKYENNARF